MKVTITETAWSDMLSIAYRIKQDSPTRASTFLGELYARCQSLVSMPRAFPLVSGHEEKGVRRCLHGKYLIFYRISGTDIEIIHVLHGAMEYENLLFGED